MLTSSASSRLQKIRASASPPAPGRADMDVAVGHDFGPGADRRGDDEIGVARVDLGAGTDRLGYQPRLGYGRGGVVPWRRRHFRGAWPAGLCRVRREARETD